MTVDATSVIDDPADDGICVPEQPQADTPWMTPREAAAWSRRHYQTVYDALRLYEATRHKQGLRGYRSDGGRWSIHRDDVDAWIRGERPAHHHLHIT